MISSLNIDENKFKEKKKSIVKEFKKKRQDKSRNMFELIKLTNKILDELTSCAQNFFQSLDNVKETPAVGLDDDKRASYFFKSISNKNIC